MKSSITMQTYIQMPPAGLHLHASQQTSCSRVPRPTAQAQYSIAQQRMSSQQNNQQSYGLWKSQASSQPVSSSSHLQSSQMPQAWITDSQNQMLLRNSASVRAPLPNGHFEPLAAAQHGTHMQSLRHHPQTLNRNIISQQNYNMPPLHNFNSTTTVSCFPSVNSNADSATEQNNLTYQSGLPQYQSLSGHHNRMQTAHQSVAQPQTDQSVQSNRAQQKVHDNQGWIRGGNGALHNLVHYFTATPESLTTPSQPSNFSHQTGHNQSYNRTQVQHSSQIQHQPSPCRTENSPASYINLKPNRINHQSLKLPDHPSYMSQHCVIQSQSNQRINQSSALSLSQDNIQPKTPLQQCQTIPVSGHHSKTYHSTVPAFQGNAQPQASHLNNSINGLTRSNQFAISWEASPPIYTQPALNYSQVNQMDGNVFVKDSILTPTLRHDTSLMSCPKAGFTTQGQTPSHIITKENYTRTPEFAPNCSAPSTLHSKELHMVNEYQTPVQKSVSLKENEHVLSQLKAPAVQIFEGMQSRRLLTDTKTERISGHHSNNGHEEVQYSEDAVEPLELLMALQKVLRQSHKAVAVVPPCSQQVPTTEKNDHASTSSDDSLPFKINAVWTQESKDVDQESNVPTLPKETIEELTQFSSVPHPEKPKSNKDEDGSTVYSLIPDTQSANIPQSKTDSTTSQGPTCSTFLTSKSPEDHNKVKTGTTNDNIFDLSMVQVHNFTLEKLIYWVKILENARKGCIKEPVADVKKCLLDLYWDGNTENVLKQMHTLHAELSDLSSKLSMAMQTAVFQYLKPKELKMLAHGCHILKHGTTLPTEEFRSSWLNIDEQPADIENVLAEPILNFNLSDYALHRGFDTLSSYSESDSSTMVIPAATDCQSEKMINKELVNSQVCESKSAAKVSIIQEASKKQEDEENEKHQQQDVYLNPEESVVSNEMEKTLTESKSKAEYKQVCREASEDITYSSEILEQSDLSNDLNSSNDSQLISASLLSADEAKTIFKEYAGCDLQKETSQLWQDKTKVSDNESNGFCNSTNQIKFTCPHMTGVDWVGEHFCPRCWEETPILDLDMEEPLFSPNGLSPKQGPRNGSCSLQDSNCTELSESTSIADSPSVEVTVSEPDPNSTDAVESCTSLSGKSPVKEPHAPSVGYTVPAKAQICEANISVLPEIHMVLPYAQNTESLVIPEQTTTPRDEVSPSKSPPCKKVKLTNATEIPAKDNLFTPDMIKNAYSTKPHQSDLSVTPSEDVQNCKDERKEQEERKVPINHNVQMNGKPDPNVNICSVRSSNSSNPSTYGVNLSVTDPHSKLDASTQSCSSPSPKSPDKGTHRRVCSESVKVTMSLEKQVCKADGLLGAELHKARSLSQNTENVKPVIQSQTKTSRKEVSPPRYPPCKKVKITKTVSMPIFDDLFTSDIVVKKTSLPKPHPSDLNVSLTEGGQHCKDEWKERGKEGKSSLMLKIQLDQPVGHAKTEAHRKCKTPSVKSQVPNNTSRQKRPAVAANLYTNKEKELGKTKGTGQNKRMKKLRFTLYGFNNSRTTPISAPAYITVSNRPATGTCYTKEPSAKQKVYSQWSSTFVETKNTSSYKNHHKSVKVELKSRTKALKKLLEDRIAKKEK